VRVKCEKCGASYAVNEALIPPKGARAQCPKCKALQIVHRAEAAAESPAPGPGAIPAPVPVPPSSRPVDPFGASFAPPAQGAATKDPVDPWSTLPPKPNAAPTANSTPGPLGDPFDLRSPSPSSGGPLDPFDLPPAPTAAKPDPFGVALGAPAPKPIDPFALGPTPKPNPPADPLSVGPSPAPAPKGNPFDLGPDPAPFDFEFGATPAAAPPDPFGLGPKAPPKQAPADLGLGDPFSAPPAKAAAGKAAVVSFKEPAGQAAPWDVAPKAPVPDLPQAQGPVIPCRVCKVPLPDPLDAAIGVCEACRTKEQTHESAPAAASKPAVRVGGAAAEAPPPPNPAADFLDAPAASLDSQGLELDLGAHASAPRQPEKAPESPPPTKPPSQPPTKQPSKQAPRSQTPMRASRRSPLKAILGGLGLLLVGGAAYVYFAQPAWVPFHIPTLAELRAPEKPKILPEVESRLLGWKMAAVGLKGTAQEHYQEGRKLFLEDRPTAYIAAEEKFKAAVVLEPSDLRSVASYVEALAGGRGANASQEALDEALELIQAVLRISPDMSLAHRAYANLLLATDEFDKKRFDDARSEAERASQLAKPEEQAEAMLAWGRSYLKTSAPIAREKIEAALEQDKALKRAYYYRGLAAENAGRYNQAVTAYEERLKLDPDQREALAALARVYAQIGDFESARKALARFAAKHPDVGEPRVLMAQYAYQVERNAREAERTLKGLKPDFDRFDDRDKLQYLSLYAAVTRERGDAKAAAGHVEAALAINPAWAPARFQGMLLALSKGDAAKAREHYEGCKKALPETWSYEYLGRIEAAAGRLDQAVSAYRSAIDAGPSRISVRLAGAALMAKKGELNAAWSTLRRSLEQDISPVSRQARPVTDYYELPVEGARVAAGVFDGLAQEEENWLRDVYAAVVRYHLGEIDGPIRAWDRALVSDPTSLPALMYRAQAELDRRRYDKALVFAKRAVDAESQSGGAHYLVGLAEEGLKKTENARLAYLKAIEKSPSHVGATLRLGALALAQGDKEEAKSRLIQVLISAPETTEARTKLFELGY